MNNQKLFIDETEEIISLDEIKAHFENGMTAEEKAEYNNNFDEYLACCMYWNGGTLAPYEEDEVMEKVLTFKYPFEQTKIKDKLKAVLSENHIEFICYESNNYYPHEFIVRKSGRKWNDLYSIINSVKPAKYSFKNTVIDMYNGKLVEVVHC